MKILYTGIGSNESGEHTEKEFLNIMRKEFTHKTWRFELHICTFKTPTKWAVMSERGDADCAFETRNGVKEIPRENHYQLRFKDWVLPDDFIFFTLSDWIEYSGAEIGV
jgi:hypothetical protein